MSAMDDVAECIARILEDPDDEDVRVEISSRVTALCERFPLYN